MSDIKPQSDSILKKRLRKFKSMKRGYYSFILICTLYVLSFLNPILVNNQALIVSYEGNTYFPAVSSLFKPLFDTPNYEGKQFGQTEVFGKTLFGEPNYRELQKQFEKEGKGNWVLMPIYPYSPVENLLSEISSEPPTAPDSKHIFGTDNRGRDVFARLAYGFQISISFAILVTVFAYSIGISIGAMLGYFGGKVDIFGQRIIEVFSGIPFLFMMMILVSFVKPSFLLLGAMLVFIGGWIGMTYFVRGEFYREKAKDYVSAAISIGTTDVNVMFKHILPNALTPVITFAPFAIVGYISSLVALDFLGFGLAPPTPSWGELISQGTQDIRYWWLIVSPLVAMFFTLLTIIFIGEGIREAFDPKVYSRLR